MAMSPSNRPGCDSSKKKGGLSARFASRTTLKSGSSGSSVGKSVASCSNPSGTGTDFPQPPGRAGIV